MPKLLAPEWELTADEYARLAKRPLYIDVPGGVERIKLSVEAMQAELARTVPATAERKAAKVFRCATCGRTNFNSQAALNMHHAYESGKRKPAGIAAKKKRGRKRGKR